MTMFSTHVTIYHHLISQAGWNRCNLSIYLGVNSLSLFLYLVVAWKSFSLGGGIGGGIAQFCLV